jgi:hypothetical protein
MTRARAGEPGLLTLAPTAVAVQGPVAAGTAGRGVRVAGYRVQPCGCPRSGGRDGQRREQLEQLIDRAHGAVDALDAWAVWIRAVVRREDNGVTARRLGPAAAFLVGDSRTPVR